MSNNVTRRAMLGGALLSPLTILVNEAHAEKSVWTEDEVCEKLNAVLEQYEKSLDEGFQQAWEMLEDQRERFQKEQQKFILQSDVEGAFQEALLQGDPAGLVKEPTEKTLAARRLVLFQHYIVECARYVLCMAEPEPDEKLMRAVEDKLGIPEPGLDDFRRGLLSCYGAHVLMNVYQPHEDNVSITPSLLCPRFHKVKVENG